jgi:hypothetical protein
MANLIERVQGMVNDPAVQNSVDGTQFTAQHVQDTLDRYVHRFRHTYLDYEPTYANNAAYTYQDYNAPFNYGDWEEDAIFQNASYVVITPDDADWISGHWHFSQSYPPPVYMELGKTYDVNAAAAVLLREWIARVALLVNYTGDGRSFQLAQQREGLLMLAQQYESKRRPVSVRMRRTDLGPSSAEQNWRFRDANKTPRTPPTP